MTSDLLLPGVAVAAPSRIRVRECALFYLPIKARVPLKFGAQVVEQLDCIRVRVTVEDGRGRQADGWGETPLMAGWAWPSPISQEVRERRMKDFCQTVAREVVAFDLEAHPLELGDAFQRERLGVLQAEEQGNHPEAMPLLAGLMCHAAFDIAIHDAFGQLHDRSVFDLLGQEFLPRDLSHWFGDRQFAGKRVEDYLRPREPRLTVWHLVGGLDALDDEDLNRVDSGDGYPKTLREWIRADGLRCLKIMLQGTDAEWDYRRIVDVGRIAIQEGCDWLGVDFNGTVTDPAYVCEVLDRLMRKHPQIYGMLLYVEQPFPMELASHSLDVHSISARKPIVLDESAPNWQQVKVAQEAGWSSVALKTCKTFTGSLLSLCWAREHGMTVMVQDLTNPMLAQISHVQLAAHAGTVKGIESNSMQFYPEASQPERTVHPGVYRRWHGVLDLATLGVTGFGYRIDDIGRELPEPSMIVAS